MASWREIESIRKQPAVFRSLAARLLALPHDGLNEWEIEFLETNSGRSSRELGLIETVDAE